MDIRRVLRGLWRELKREKRAAESLPITRGKEGSAAGSKGQRPGINQGDKTDTFS